jgi:hypothetical protein
MGDSWVSSLMAGGLRVSFDGAIITYYLENESEFIMESGNHCNDSQNSLIKIELGNIILRKRMVMALHI